MFLKHNTPFFCHLTFNQKFSVRFSCFPSNLVCLILSLLFLAHAHLNCSIVLIKFQTFPSREVTEACNLSLQDSSSSSKSLIEFSLCISEVEVAWPQVVLSPWGKLALEYLIAPSQAQFEEVNLFWLAVPLGHISSPMQFSYDWLL